MTLIKSLAAKHKAGATHWCTNDTTRTFTPSVKKGRFAKAKKSKCWEFDFSFSRCGSRVDDLFHLVIERNFSARAPFVYPHVVFPPCINPLQGEMAKRKEIVQSILLRQPFTAGEYFPNTPRLEGFFFLLLLLLLLGIVRNVLVKYLAPMRPCEDQWQRHSRRLAPTPLNEELLLSDPSAPEQRDLSSNLMVFSSS